MAQANPYIVKIKGKVHKQLFEAPEVIRFLFNELTEDIVNNRSLDVPWPYFERDDTRRCDCFLGCGWYAYWYYQNTGTNLEFIFVAVQKKFDNTQILEQSGSSMERLQNTLSLKEANEIIDWKECELAKEVKARKTIGRLLSAFREAGGLSIAKVAKEADIPVQRLVDLEADRRPVSKSLAKRLGWILGIADAKLRPVQSAHIGS